MINDVLEKYITKYVLCNVCGNPETYFVMIKKTLKTECKVIQGLAQYQNTLSFKSLLITLLYITIQ